MSFISQKELDVFNTLKCHVLAPGFLNQTYLFAVSSGTRKSSLVALIYGVSIGYVGRVYVRQYRLIQELQGGIGAAGVGGTGTARGTGVVGGGHGPDFRKQSLFCHAGHCKGLLGCVDRRLSCHISVDYWGETTALLFVAVSKLSCTSRYSFVILLVSEKHDGKTCMAVVA